MYDTFFIEMNRKSWRQRQYKRISSSSPDVDKQFGCTLQYKSCDYCHSFMLSADLLRAHIQGPFKAHSHFERQTILISALRGACLWKAVVDVPCNLQRVVINLQRVLDINQ